ncbi:hypothetical protein KSF_108380 [Reticulibacter mediterranei]|uniref:Uncharacterized protein n=1 Tax=Reticulibacter mediterranei TaxID=2778369 RepID=A0A8J3IYF9_9CHLR|nr:hypothetical protein KSF_108380 [Reticulibacter mediterranei]
MRTADVGEKSSLPDKSFVLTYEEQSVRLYYLVCHSTFNWEGLAERVDAEVYSRYDI